jgi:hypothetical protein
MRHKTRFFGVGAAALVAAAAGIATYLLFFSGMGVEEASDLRQFVRTSPRYPIVFTSRTEPASFVAPAPEAEGFTYPGTIPWAATEGRLRLLETDGKVYELTWGRELPDGGTLIDVMSPTISLDGKRILFAGRKAPPDPGRWRIYEIGVDGRGLRQLTGGPYDPGCILLPPMRYAADGSMLPDDERKRTDYDDVDPIDQEKSFAFSSSRLPDLGRDHSRRATQIWLWPKGKSEPRPLTANRNNDRWPFITFQNNLLVFSLWSRNREAVTADGSDIRPVSLGGTYATRPTDEWLGARIFPVGTQFGYAVKVPEPVWRPRPLFNGQVAFMTAHPAGGGRLRLAQATWGYMRNAPSSLAADSQLPKQTGGVLQYAPDRDADGRELTMGCPSPYPESFVLFSGAPVGAAAGAFGLYLLPEDWSSAQTRPELLFDDPRLVDAEPVAVYPRPIVLREVAVPPTQADYDPPADFRLANGKEYTGPVGQHHNNVINRALPNPFPGQETDTGATPVVPFPTGVKSFAIYASYRDRFDDPEVPRIRGGWERLLTVPMHQGQDLLAWVPADPAIPTVLAGLGADGKVFKWGGGAKDSTGQSATFYALAGDHYSGTRKNGYHFCVGCHAGHTFINADLRERMGE